MAKKRIKESMLRNIIRESIVRALNEGATADSGLYEMWEQCIEYLTPEGMLSELWNCMSADEIRSNLEWIDRNYDLGLFDEEDGEMNEW